MKGKGVGTIHLVYQSPGTNSGIYGNPRNRCPETANVKDFLRKREI